jgi:hypothetical protein
MNLTYTTSAAIRAHGAEEWQDISTAPKDGTIVDLFGTRNGHPRRFTDAAWRPIASWGTGEPTDKYRWMFDAFDHYGVFEFTHWMPLPAPPIQTIPVHSEEADA